jgi:hypothetical protein
VILIYCPLHDSAHHDTPCLHKVGLVVAGEGVIRCKKNFPGTKIPEKTSPLQINVLQSEKFSPMTYFRILVVVRITPAASAHRVAARESPTRGSVVAVPLPGTSVAVTWTT